MARGKNIKGITIQLEGETKGLNAALQSVNKESRKLSTELRDVDRALKLDPTNMDMLGQKQAGLQKQLDLTTNKLEALKEAQKEASEQLARGDISQEQYDKLAREIVKTTGAVERFSKQLKEVDNALDLSDADKEFTRLMSSMKQSEVESAKLKTELKEVEAALKMNPGNTELIAQKQRLLSEEAGITSRRLDAMRGSYTQLEAAASSGDLGADKFDKLKREIISAENRMGHLDTEMQELTGNEGVENATKDMRDLKEEAGKTESAIDGVGGALAGLGTGLSVGAIFSEGLDMASMENKVQRVTGLVGEQNEEVRKLVRTMGAYGVDGDEALETVRRQLALNREESYETNLELAKTASIMSTMYTGLDSSELVQETYELGKQLDISQQEAMALANELIKVGFPPERLDELTEYSQILRGIGFTAEDVGKVVASAVAAGGENIDRTLDGFKELSIRLREQASDMSNGLKDALREYVGDAQAMSQEQLDHLKKTLDEEVRLREDALNKQAEVQSKHHDEIEKARKKELDNELKALEKGYSEQQKALENQQRAEVESVNKSSEARIKAMGKLHESQTEAANKAADQQQKALDKRHEKQLKSVERSIEGQQKALEKSQEKELSDAERVADKKINLINKEYVERLKLVDEERYRALKAVDDEIAGIEGKIEAEDKAEKKAEEERRRRELQDKVSQADSASARQQALQDLNDFENDLQRQRVREQRQAQIEDLKNRKDNIKEQYDARVESLKNEEQASIDSANRQNEANLEAIRTRQAQEKQALDDQNAARIEAVRATQEQEKQVRSERRQAAMDALREQQEQEKTALNESKDVALQTIQERQERERESFEASKASRIEQTREAHNSELEGLKEVHDEREKGLEEIHQAELRRIKEANEMRMNSAKSPAESDAYKDQVAQIEEWGRALAEGGDGAGEALMEALAWLDGVDDKLLQNKLGVELMGTQWEDSGDVMLETMRNYTNGLGEIDEASFLADENVKKLLGSTETIDSDPIVQMKEAFNDLLFAMGPVLLALAGILTKVFEWINANPELAGMIAMIVGALIGGGGLLVAINSVVGAISGLAGLFSLVMSPAGLIGLAILALVAGVAYIITHWEGISTFFSNLFSRVGETLSNFGESAKNKFNEAKTFVTDIWQSIPGFFSGIWTSIVTSVGILSEGIKSWFRDAKNGATDIWSGVTEFFNNIWSGITEGAGSLVSDMASIFKDIYEKIKEILSIDKMKEIGKNIIDGLKEGLKDSGSKSDKI